MTPLLEIEDLIVRYPGRGGPLFALRGVSLALGRERLGIVGESGSGKSTLGRAILGLLPPVASVSAARLSLGGVDLRGASEDVMRANRGRRIAMILQDPKFSLNPTMTIGRQIAESYRFHTGASMRPSRNRAIEMLDAVKIREPERVYALYPHQVSGGMGQRAMIAMMLALEPEILIADEPTSALDATVQVELLALLDDLVRTRGMGLMLISHNLNMVASFCDRVAVLYAGQVMEVVDAGALGQARHPYTRGLLACRPLIERVQDELPQLQRDPAWIVPHAQLAGAA
jgi:peptide/nickel transport system ATP-binding protein